MNWIILVFAGLFEVVFAFCLGKAKASAGNDIYLWYTGFVVALCISMGLLLKATQTLPLGSAYAVWTGIGAVGTVLVGIIVFKETHHLLAAFIPSHFNRLYHRAQSGVTLSFSSVAVSPP